MSEAENRRTIQTRFGRDVEITDRNVIRIAGGLLGFEDFEQFAVIPHNDDSPFFWLQSIEEAGLAFITIDPRLFAPEYVPDLSEEDLASLGLKDAREAVLLSIVVIPDDPNLMTANLQAPVVVNAQSRVGRQVISRSVHHRVRHYILTKSGERPEG